VAETANGCLVLHRAGTIAERQKPRPEELEKTFHALFPSASESFFLLTRDYHGTSFSFCGVNQDLGDPRRRVAQGCDIKLSHSFTPALWHYTLESIPLYKARCVLCDPRS
jgi:hypothetical protein